jgi:hypothetical protein
MISNNYSSLEDFEKPEDKQKGRIGAISFVVVILIFLVFPWFTTTYPIPEAEGLMASFGDVELAGGSEDFVKPAEPTPPQPEPVKTEPVVEEVDDVETVENDEDPIVDEKPEPTPTPPTPTPEPTPTPTPPKPDPGSLFSGSGKTNGKGTGTGDGVQGTPDGKGDLGGTGNGEKGKGKGKIGSRRRLSKCEDYKAGNASWQEKGTAVVTICVNARGKVVDASINRRKTTITSQALIDLVVGCAKEYRYEKAPGSPEACGDITIQLGVN